MSSKPISKIFNGMDDSPNLTMPYQNCYTRQTKKIDNSGLNLFGTNLSHLNKEKKSEVCHNTTDVLSKSFVHPQSMKPHNISLPSDLHNQNNASFNIDMANYSKAMLNDHSVLGEDFGEEESFQDKENQKPDNVSSSSHDISIDSLDSGGNSMSHHADDEQHLNTFDKSDMLMPTKIQMNEKSLLKEPFAQNNGYNNHANAESTEDKLHSTIKVFATGKNLATYDFLAGGENQSSLNSAANRFVNRGNVDSEQNYKKNQRGMYNPITGESYD